MSNLSLTQRAPRTQSGAQRSARPTIGRWVVVVHRGLQRVGTVMDQVAGTDRPKRVRIQRGDLQGQVVGLGEYDFLRWLEDTEVDE